MVRKLRSSRLSEWFRYAVGGDPRDEWEFTVAGKHCLVVNGWRSGIALFVEGTEVARYLKLYSIRGEKPLISSDIVDGSGGTARVDVYVRAITGVTMQVRVNDVPLQDAFI